MNPRYRKAMRLRSRHHRRGHNPWCRCPEPWMRALTAFRRWRTSGCPLPTRTVHPREYDHGGILRPGLAPTTLQPGERILSREQVERLLAEEDGDES